MCRQRKPSMGGNSAQVPASIRHREMAASGLHPPRAGENSAAASAQESQARRSRRCEHDCRTRRVRSLLFGHPCFIQGTALRTSGNVASLSRSRRHRTMHPRTRDPASRTWCPVSKRKSPPTSTKAARGIHCRQQAFGPQAAEWSRGVEQRHRHCRQRRRPDSVSPSFGGKSNLCASRSTTNWSKASIRCVASTRRTSQLHRKSNTISLLNNRQTSYLLIL